MNRIIPILIIISGTCLSQVLTLKEVEQKALDQSFAMQAQRSEERSKEWEKWNTVAGYMPSADYTLTYMQMDATTVENANSGFDFINQGLPPGTPPLENYNELYEKSFAHEIKVTQPIFNGGAEVVAISIARHTKKAIELQEKSAEQDAVYNARKAYFDAITAAEWAKISEQSLVWAKQNLVRSRAKQAAGSVPITDVMQWEAEVLQKESDVLQARAIRQTAMLGLYAAMGMTVSQGDRDAELEGLGVFEKWYRKGQMPTNAQAAQGPQYQSLQSYTKAAKGYRNLSVSAFLPKVNAFYQYSWPAWDKFEPRDDRKGWTAGVIATVPLFSGFRNSTGVKKAGYQYHKAVVQEQETLNGLEMNFERIALMYRASYKSVEASRKQSELMEKQMRIMQKRYDGGLVSQSQLLEVALGAQQTRLAYVQKLFECLLLESEYRKNAGQLEVTQ